MSARGRGPWTTSKRLKRSSSSSGRSGGGRRRASGGSRALTMTWGNKYQNAMGRGSMSWHGSPFPRVLRTQVTYSMNSSITSALGDCATHLIRTGGLFDPNFTGVGSQPRFFDSLCGATGGTTPYSAYRVYGSRIKVTFISVARAEDNGNDRAFCGVGCFDQTSTPPTSLAELMARSDYKTGYLGVWSGGADHAVIQMSMNQANLFGVKDISDNEDVGAAYNANPVLDGRWGITVCPADQNGPRSYVFFATVTYDCEFYRRNDVVDS